MPSTKKKIMWYYNAASVKICKTVDNPYPIPEACKQQFEV